MAVSQLTPLGFGVTWFSTWKNKTFVQHCACFTMHAMNILQTVLQTGSCQLCDLSLSNFWWPTSCLLNWSECLHMSLTPIWHHEWICTAPVEWEEVWNTSSEDFHSAHSSLDHLHALLSHLSNHSRHIHYTLSLHLLQDGVNSYECSCATHTSTGDIQ